MPDANVQSKKITLQHIVIRTGNVDIEFDTYIHHARIVDINPESKLFLVSESLKFDRGEFCNKYSEQDKSVYYK